ncbi:MAG: TIGR03862 family flavoprotein [Proteobacteria bacterium]|nr:TIGR03862 family flavoprotein [Pseudomonadota bacterium]
MTYSKLRIAVVGSGPAGLMAADVLASAGARVQIFEKRKGSSWKLFIAGSSGLNISNNLPFSNFASHYTGPADFWLRCLDAFSPQDWLDFIEKNLEIGTFLGTSGRYFVETMHAAKLVRQWRRRLEGLGVIFQFDRECIGFNQKSAMWTLNFRQNITLDFDAICFCLGGGSWETEEDPLRWPKLFQDKNIGFENFTPSNTGYELAWSTDFLKEAEGLPLKNICLRSSRGERRGDLIITNYGIEGTPVYFTGEVGQVYLDLKPDLSIQAISQKLSKAKENLSPLRRAQKYLHLSPASLALLFHMAPAKFLQSIPALSEGIKNFPLELLRPRPLRESISSQGGILWSELDQGLMLKNYPGIYCAGEMIDWDAPTGGFLIQACVAQGAWAARHILYHCKPQNDFLGSKS